MEERERPVFVVARKFDELYGALKSRMNILHKRILFFSFFFKGRDKIPPSREEEEVRFISVSLFIVADFRRRTFAKPANKSWEIDEDESADRESRGRTGTGKD